MMPSQKKGLATTKTCPVSLPFPQIHTWGAFGEVKVSQEETNIDELLHDAAAGNRTAIGRLLRVHRQRLRRMVRIHIDDELAARVDPSDVVQDTLAEASQKIVHYAKDQPIPFYPWLRQMAWQRIIKTREFHLAQKRSINKEQRWDLSISGGSVAELANRFCKSQSTPSQRLVRAEQRLQIRQLIETLSRNDREVLILRYLEQLSASECAEVLAISYDTYMKRHMRAVSRLRRLLETISTADEST